MFPEAKPRGTLRSRGNKTHCFPRGQSLSVLLYLSTQIAEKNCENMICTSGSRADRPAETTPR